MSDLDELYVQWTRATDKLQPGVKRVFHEVLASVEDGSMTTLVYGTDYSGSGVCLVNASAAMLKVGGGQGVPSANFPEVVSLFDRINKELLYRGVNTDHYVSPLAADILLHHYAPLDEPTTLANELGKAAKELNASLPQDVIYVEPSDEAILEAMLTTFNNPAPSDPFDEFSDNEPFPVVKVTQAPEDDTDW